MPRSYYPGYYDSFDRGDYYDDRRGRGGGGGGGRGRDYFDERPRSPRFPDPVTVGLEVITLGILFYANWYVLRGHQQQKEEQLRRSAGQAMNGQGSTTMKALGVAGNALALHASNLEANEGQDSIYFALVFMICFITAIYTFIFVSYQRAASAIGVAASLKVLTVFSLIALVWKETEEENYTNSGGMFGDFTNSVEQIVEAGARLDAGREMSQHVMICAFLQMLCGSYMMFYLRPMAMYEEEGDPYGKSDRYGGYGRY